MDVKTTRSKIEIAEWGYGIAIMQSDMYRAYMQLDLLLEDVFGEICFYDPASFHKVYLKRAENENNPVRHDCMLLSDSDIDCIKRMISQCHMNPHDAAWMHFDLEARTSTGEEWDVCVRLLAEE